MAGASLLMLIDDIASILDDVSAMAQTAAKKTAGMIGDDLAVNAHQVHGLEPDRELPVVWAVARGSLVNKVILVPAALAISALAPWLIVPLLMVGGAFLCFEGAEKVLHRLLDDADPSGRAAAHAQTAGAVADPQVDMVSHERSKIRGAIRTDFILSAEIIIITLGVVAESSLVEQLGVLVTIAMLMTVCVYGLVGGIVKFDDLGLHLARRPGPSALARLARRCGRGVLCAAPWLLKGLTVIGTAAMFLVGGDILVHGVSPLAHWLEAVLPGGVPGAIAAVGVNTLAGLVAGSVLVLSGRWLVRLRAISAAER